MNFYKYYEMLAETPKMILSRMKEKTYSSSSAGSVHPIEKFLRSPWMQQSGICFAVDVGANEGQFARMFRASFPDAFIVSFEPIEECFQQLVNNFKDDSRFDCYKVGVGEKKEIITFYKTNFSPASSFLKMKKETASAFAIESDCGQEKMQVDTLDNLLLSFDVPSRSFLKIDTQGFEMKILRGAKNLLDRFDFVLLELSLCQLYEEEPLFDDVYQFMIEKKFVVKAFLDVLKDPVMGKHLQVDVLFGKA